VAETELTAAWLSPSCLMLAGPLGGAQPEATLEAEDGQSEVLDVRYLPLAPAATDGSLLVATMPAGAGPGANRNLVMRVNGERLAFSNEDLKRITVEVPAMVRERFAPLDASARARLMELLAASMGDVPHRERHDLSERLYRVREALRERLPVMIVEQDRRRGLQIDRVMAVDERFFFVEGWLHIEGLEPRRLTAVSPEGARAELVGRMARLPRPDATESLALGAHRARERVGFLCSFQLSAPSLHRDGWMFEVEDDRGEQGEMAAPGVMTGALDVREAILEDPQAEKLSDEASMRDHIHPAISRIQERLDTGARIESVVQHGEPPESPDVTIVIPLYRQVEHLEVQLSQFVEDSDIGRADLIYVLDSPEDASHLRRYAAELHPIYGIPFRVATLAANAGFAGASNAGASLARGRLLLLLNSDVLPAAPGWLSHMRDFHDATPGIGALGAKLLYEDDSIQHAGMHFVPFPDPAVRQWVDSTYFKGMHTSLPAANIARPVPAVSGACMMIDRGLWEEVGGLQRIYVRGDYEDSHLCLELRERGRENWYLPEAVLYHLEGQSYGSRQRGPSNRYNAWLYSRLWGDRIESIAGRVFELPEPAAAADRR
jgi:O-antigen biosynthesis protein